MNILLGGTSDNGAGSWFLADAINKYTEHDARAVRGYQSYLEYPFDIVAPSVKQMDELIEWADVVHIRDALPKSRRGLRGKRVVITYTGRVFRKGHASVYKAHRLGYKICVSTPDMAAFCPDVNPMWLPNPREDMSHAWRPTRRSFAVQCPTSRQGKHTEIVTEGARLAGVPIDIVEQSSYRESIRRKARARVVIDQLKYGFGNNAIEGWALGMPVISGFSTPLAKVYRKAIERECGGIPFVIAGPSPKSVARALRRLRDDHEFYQEMIERGREHFFKFHHAPVVAKKAAEIYESIS